MGLCWGCAQHPGLCCPSVLECDAQSRVHPNPAGRDFQGYLSQEEPDLPSPTAACRLTPATNMALGSLACRCLIYCMLEDVREGSAFRQACFRLSLAPVQCLR